MTTPKKLGIFPWYSLMSTAPAKSFEFFKNLFTLTNAEFEMPGAGKVSLLQKGEMAYADVSPVTGKEPSHWATYLTVENLETFLPKAKKMGATITPAFEIPTIGKAAAVIDPCGATFFAFTPNDWSKTTSALGMEEGMICWNELMVKEPQKAITFYGECMGWKFTKEPMNDGIEYNTITTADGAQVGGIMKNPPMCEDMAPMWMPYMLTKDVKATTKKAEQLGAKVLMPYKEIPNTGAFSFIQDPTGCMTYLFTALPKK